MEKEIIKQTGQNETPDNRRTVFIGAKQNETPDNRRTVFIGAKVSPRQKEHIKSLAEQCGMTVSDYLLARAYNYKDSPKRKLHCCRIWTTAAKKKLHFCRIWITAVLTL